MRMTFAAGLAAVFSAGAAIAAPAAQQAPLRLCADPANMPFSTQSEAAAKAGSPGLYVEIGQAVADALGRPMETTWSQSYFGKRNLGATLLAGQCDFAVGLPADDDFMGPRVIFSKPILSVGYAIAAPRSLQVKRLADLDGKRVAVQFNSPPQSLTATQERIDSVTVMDPDEGMGLLASGKVDAAFVWGPSAGYDNHVTRHDGFVVTAVDAPQMQFPAAIGFARKSTALRDEVDAVLPALAPRIEAIAAKYAVPTAPGVTLVAGQSEAPVSTATAEPAHEDASTDAVAQGREIFNGTCAHCHGPDAIQSERRINLRLLKHRYGEDTQQVFMTTVTKGRPAKGMPTWEGVFSNDDFNKIYAFLSTVQNP